MADEGKTGLWVTVVVDFDSRRRLQCLVSKMNVPRYSPRAV